MSKFDRCIFISIAIGIWALAMTQVFKPEILQAVSSKAMGQNIASVTGSDCPNGMKNMTKYGNGETFKNEFCYWQLVVTIEDMKKYPDFFK